MLGARTGELLAAGPFQKTTWASSIDLNTGKPVLRPEARYWESKDPNPIHVFPSANGGKNWNSIVIDGAFAPRGMFAFGPLGMKPEQAEAIQAHVIEEAWKAYEAQEKAEK